jgi:long-chain acyl-CoA synthetase
VDYESAKIAGLLRAREIGAGERVGLRMGDMPQFAAIFYGILQVGAVVVLLDPRLGDDEVERVMAGTGARLLFDEPSARLAGHTADHTVTPRPGDDLAVIAGRVTLTHNDLASAATPPLTRADILALVAEKDNAP